MGSEGKEERPKARPNPFTPFCPIAFHLQASPSGYGCPRLPWSVGDLVSTSKMLTVSSQCPVFSGWQKRGGVMLLLRISHPAPPAPSQVAQYFHCMLGIQASNRGLPGSHGRGGIFFPTPGSPTALPASLAGILHCAEEQGTKDWRAVLCNSEGLW